MASTNTVLLKNNVLGMPPHDGVRSMKERPPVSTFFGMQGVGVRPTLKSKPPWPCTPRSLGPARAPQKPVDGPSGRAMILWQMLDEHDPHDAGHMACLLYTSPSPRD